MRIVIDVCLGLPLVFLISEAEIIRLPPFQPAKAPRHIESKGNDREHHDEKPGSEKSDSCAKKSELAIADEGVLGNPSLLSGVGPWKK